MTKKKTAPEFDTQTSTHALEEGADNKKPTAEEKTPQGAENVKKETETTEAITLDRLEAFTLPGDSDTEEEEAPRWRIADDGCADWALKKIKLEKDEHDRIIALAQAEIKRLQEMIEKAERRYEQNTSFLTSKLYEFFHTVPHKKTKAGQESYRLLNGSLIMKPEKVKIEANNPALVTWLQENGHEEFIKVEGNDAILTETGEIIQGVNITKQPAEFSVKL